MARAVDTERVQGLLIPDTRIGPDNLVARGTGTTDSKYSQASCRPGVPVADTPTAMVLEASGTQTDAGKLEIASEVAGDAGVDRGAFTWRDRASWGASAKYQGFEGYQSIAGYDVLYAGSGSAGGGLPNVIRLSTGYLLAVHEEEGTATDPQVQTERYDPSTRVWTRATEAVAGSAADQPCPCLVEIPTAGRVLLLLMATGGRNIIVRSSDDSGSTWTAGSAYYALRTALPSGSTVRELRAAWSGGQIVLFIQYNDGAAEQIAQYASSDDGATFDQVFYDWTVSGENPTACSVAALTGGGFMLVYARGHATDRYRAIVIGSAYESAQAGEAFDLVTLAPTTTPSCAVWQDEDGAVYALASINEAATYSLSLFRSQDRGESWERWGGPVAELHPGAVDAWFCEFAACAIGSQAVLLTRYTVPAESDANSALICLWLGGHSDKTVPATSQPVGASLTVTDRYPDYAYVPWSESDTNGLPGGFWLGVEEPTLLGWSVAGAGADSITADLRLQIDAAGARVYSRAQADVDVTAAIVEFSMQTDGGDATTDQAAATITISDYDGATPGSATFTYTVQVRIDAAGFAIYDQNAGAIVGAKTLVDLSDGADRVRIRVVIDSAGNLISAYATQSPQYVRWADGPATGVGSLTNTPADVENIVAWGALANASNAYWYHVGYCYWGTAWSSQIEKASGLARTWGDPHPRTFPASPMLLHDGVKIAAVDGPTMVGDSWVIEPESDYALANVFPSVAPSPRRVWRNAADGVEQFLTFKLDEDFTESRLLGHPVGLVLMNSNLATVVLESWNGAAWSTVATWDSTSDWTALAYDRRGGMLIPRVGAPTTGARYFWYGAHVGDTVDLSTGTADDLQIVRRNSEGAWHTGETVKRPTIELERTYLPGALPDQAFGTMLLRRKDAGVVAASYNSNDYLLRLRIPVQSTAEGYYRIGSLLLGHVAVFGHQYDSGWGVTREFDTELFRRQGGTRRSRVNGPSRRVVEMNWTETAIDASRVQAKDPVPDWVRSQTGVELAIASPADLVHLLDGVMVDRDGPGQPVVWISRMDTDSSDSHALSDPRGFVYGRIESEMRADNVTGDEGVSELTRVGTLTIREEV